MQLRRDGPAISIVIPNFNGAECLKTCLQSLAGQVQDDGEVLVVDNASRDGSLEVARLAAPGARILRLESNAASGSRS
jgi:glycosyltransferase involved in cell wall biosynthesis